MGMDQKRSHVWVLDQKEGWALKNWWFRTVVLQKTLESPLNSKEIKPVNPKRKSILNIHQKDWYWRWSSSTLATCCKELTHWKKPWCWERVSAWGAGGNRGWDGWMASPTQWTWVLANSRRWWRTGNPGFWQSMGSKRAGHNLPTEKQQYI